MDTKELYREILNEHNINPTHKVAMDSPDFCLEGVNPSCGDQITLQLKLGEDGKISDAELEQAIKEQIEVEEFIDEQGAWM